MPNKPTTVPQLDTNQTNRTVPAPSKVTDGFVLNDILPSSNVNYLWGWGGDWLDWLDQTFGDGAAAGDLQFLGTLLDVTVGDLKVTAGDLTVTAGTLDVLAGLASFAGGADVDSGLTVDGGLTVSTGDITATVGDLTVTAGTLDVLAGLASFAGGVNIDGGLIVDSGDARFDEIVDVRAVSNDDGIRAQAGSTFLWGLTREGSGPKLTGLSTVAIWTGATSMSTGTPAVIVNSSQQMGIGATPECQLHLWSADIRALDTDARLAIEGGTNASINVLSTGIGALRFGDAAAANAGSLQYAHATDTLTLAQPSKSVVLNQYGLGIDMTPLSTAGPLQVDLPTSQLGIVDADYTGTQGSTESGYIELKITGNTRYIKVYS